MNIELAVKEVNEQFSFTKNHKDNNYFNAIRRLIDQRDHEQDLESIQQCKQKIDFVYELLRDEILTNNNAPITPVKFGTSGWRGLLGKDLSIRSVAFVTEQSLTGRVPAGYPVGGPYDLLVMNPDGGIGYLTGSFTVANQPVPEIS